MSFWDALLPCLGIGKIERTTVMELETVVSRTCKMFGAIPEDTPQGTWVDFPF